MFTVTRDEFRDIHNGMCYLHHAMRRLEDVLSAELYNELAKARDGIEKGFVSVRKQESDRFDRLNTHYRHVADQHRLRTAVWSIYEVESLYDVAAEYDDAAALDYMGKRVLLQSGPKTWLDLFKAADTVIREADDYHVFVEGFYKTTEPGVISLTTGS